jgi:hypothetical protein
MNTTVAVDLAKSVLQLLSFQAVIAFWLAQYETEISFLPRSLEAKAARLLGGKLQHLFCRFIIVIVTVSANGRKYDGEARWLWCLRGGTPCYPDPKRLAATDKEDLYLPGNILNKMYATGHIVPSTPSS